MADNRKLLAGLLNLPRSAQADLAQQAEDYERLKQADYLRKMGDTGMGLAKSVARGVPQMATGLVDLAAMPFEAAGIVQPGQAVGSTKWLESKGYLPESQEGFLNQTAELLSGGFDPSDLATKGLPLLAGIGKTVWHGSPHSFEKFDLSKIGTGEGAQAYGHGLYLADAPETAKSYSGKLSSELSYNGKPMNRESGRNTKDSAAWALYLAEGDKEAAKASGLAKPELIDKLDYSKIQPGGQLYKVDLPDEQIAKMLDWDKPLSEQAPEIQELARSMDISNAIGRNRGVMQAWREGRDVGIVPRGEHLYEALAGSGKFQPEASQQLFEQGIPGIRYLDQASRGAGEGTSNYVVFSDEIPQILERNGQPMAQALREYRGAHSAPGPEFGAQLHDVTGGGAMYPEDIYSAQGARIYGHGGSDVAMDKETMKIIQGMRNRPDEMVDIYRAVPNQEEITSINPGDWITINPNYAKQHGESNLPEGYKILQQKVPAKSVWTNADSIHEYGYWPE